MLKVGTKVYKHRVSAKNREGYFVVEKVTQTKKEAETAKAKYLKRKEVVEVEIASLKQYKI